MRVNLLDLDTHLKRVRKAIRNFCAGMNLAELRRELEVTQAQHDEFRAQVIQEVIEELCAERAALRLDLFSVPFATLEKELAGAESRNSRFTADVIREILAERAENRAVFPERWGRDLTSVPEVQRGPYSQRTI